MIRKSIILRVAGAIVLGAANSQAQSFVYISDFGQGLNFGSSSSSSGAFGIASSSSSGTQTALNYWAQNNGIDTSTLNSSAQFFLDGSADPKAPGDSYGLSCWFSTGAQNGGSWSYTSISSSGVATCSSSSAVKFYIGNGLESFFSGTVDSVKLGTASGNAVVTINIDNLSGLGTANGDLSELLSSAKSGSLDFTMILNPSSFSGLKGNAAISSITLSAGPVISPVPETTTMLAGAGAVGLLFLGAGAHSKRNVFRIGKAK